MIAKTTAWSMVKQHPAMVAAARLAAGEGNVVIYIVAESSGGTSHGHGAN
jgi:hypothetical protein